MNQQLKQELQQLLKKYQSTTKLIVDGKQQQSLLEVAKGKQTLKLPIMNSINQLDSTSL